MFVRFKRVPNTGQPPVGAANDVICWDWNRADEWADTRHGGRRRLRRYHIVPSLSLPPPEWGYGETHTPYCRAGPPLKRRPRAEADLTSYRIKIELVENTRVGGKVKQEIVARLGSIDATLLESFWASAPEPALRLGDWEHWSLRSRVNFWNGVLERMGAIGDNRLPPELRKAMRRAIHKLIPWPREDERKRLALLDAENNLRRALTRHEGAEKRVSRTKKNIETTKKQLEELTTEELPRSEEVERLADASLTRRAKIVDVHKGVSDSVDPFALAADEEEWLQLESKLEYAAFGVDLFVSRHRQATDALATTAEEMMSDDERKNEEKA